MLSADFTELEVMEAIMEMKKNKALARMDSLLNSTKCFGTL
jgi:hypothetical protein